MSSQGFDDPELLLRAVSSKPIYAGSQLSLERHLLTTVSAHDNNSGQETSHQALHTQVSEKAGFYLVSEILPVWP